MSQIRGGYSIYQSGRLAKFIKPVVKDGALYGSFVIKVSVDEVIFEDGTVWKEQRALDFNHKTKRYRVKVDDAKKAKAGRWAWDVFLSAQ